MPIFYSKVTGGHIQWQIPNATGTTRSFRERFGFMITTRAYSEIEKMDKKQEILMSAEDLFIKEDGVFPSVNAICTYSAMAKGTVYIYFKNKDAIILALLEKYFNEWLDPSNFKQDEVTVDTVIDGLLNFIKKNPYKFKLINTNHFLESKAGPQKVVDFYVALKQSFDGFISFVAKGLDEDVEPCANWILDTFHYLQGLWRIANPSHDNMAVLKDTELSFFTPDFYEHARKFMKNMWQQHKNEHAKATLH